MPQHILNQLHQLCLDGMARALEEKWTLPASHSLSFDERLGLLLDRELAWRDNQRLVRLHKKAKLKYANACLEDLDRRPGRALGERLFASLASGDWIRQQHNLLLTGPTGASKTWLACALGNQACRQGYSTLYLRTPRLLEQLRIAHGDGSFGRTLQQLAKVDVLVLNDWALAPLEEGARHNLLEVIDDRAGNHSTILTKPTAPRTLARLDQRPDPGRRHPRPPGAQRLPVDDEGQVTAPEKSRGTSRIVTDAITIQNPRNRGRNTGHVLVKRSVTFTEIRNYTAKRWQKQTGGVVDITDPKRRDKLLQTVAVNEVWRVGRRADGTPRRNGHTHGLAGRGGRLDPAETIQRGAGENRTRTA